MSLSFIMMDAGDTVVMATDNIPAGVTCPIIGMSVTLTPVEPIPFGHKAALRAMEKGDPIVKYGEVIAHAATPIVQGQHVHTHNMDNTLN